MGVLGTVTSSSVQAQEVDLQPSCGTNMYRSCFTQQVELTYRFSSNHISEGICLQEFTALATSKSGLGGLPRT